MKKIDIEQKIRQIHKQAVLGSPLKGAAAEYAIGILKQHPCWEEYTAPGLDYVYVEGVPGSATQRRFAICRIDGTTRDISWAKALSPLTPIQQMASVCRTLIAPQIFEYRLANYQPGLRCPICDGHPLYFDVDHKPPKTFKRLLDDWIAESNIVPANVAFTASRERGKATTFTDAAMAKAWVAFHAAQSELRMVCKECNARHKC